MYFGSTRRRECGASAEGTSRPSRTARGDPSRDAEMPTQIGGRGRRYPLRRRVTRGSVRHGHQIPEDGVKTPDSQQGKSEVDGNMGLGGDGISIDRGSVPSRLEQEGSRLSMRDNLVRNSTTGVWGVAPSVDSASHVYWYRSGTDPAAVTWGRDKEQARERHRVSAERSFRVNS